jgi:hypothetical protein
MKKYLLSLCLAAISFGVIAESVSQPANSCFTVDYNRSLPENKSYMTFTSWLTYPHASLTINSAAFLDVLKIETYRIDGKITSTTN